MIYMYRIAVIGDYESICGFAALGLEIYGVKDLEEAEETLKKLSESGFGVIYISEKYIEKMPKLFEKLSQRKLPAVIPIPTDGKSSGFGMGNVKKYVEQAVGSDILFNED